MKTSLAHLPPDKQRQLAEVVALIRAAMPVERVILFAPATPAATGSARIR